MKTICLRNLILILFYFIGNVTIFKSKSNNYFIKTFIFEDIYYFPKPHVIRILKVAIFGKSVENVKKDT